MNQMALDYRNQIKITNDCDLNEVSASKFKHFLGLIKVILVVILKSMIDS